MANDLMHLTQCLAARFRQDEWLTDDLVLAAMAARLGLEVETCSPGDGWRRYAFGRDTGDDYRTISPLLSLAEARAWLVGFESGLDDYRTISQLMSLAEARAWLVGFEAGLAEMSDKALASEWDARRGRSD